MKAYLFILVLAALFQASFVPVNLVLVLLICRSLIVQERANLFLAFGIGIFLGLLQTDNLGFWPLLFLVVTEVAHLSRGLPVFKNLGLILLVSGVLIVSSELLQALVLKEAFNVSRTVVEAVLVLATYPFLLFWEQRLVGQPGIKL